MRYVWESGKRRRRMHIMRFSPAGEESFRALCDIRLPFNRSINAPFGLGKKICRRCLRVANDLSRSAA